MSMRAVNIRALKDRLSAYLRDVAHGDVLLVTDRGRVVAELRQPTLGSRGIQKIEGAESSLVDRGALTIGLPNSAAVYGESRLHVKDATIDDALTWSRGDR